MSLKEIIAAVDELDGESQLQLFEHLRDLTMDDWDRQMIADAAPGGKLAILIERAEQEFERGECRPFP